MDRPKAWLFTKNELKLMAEGLKLLIETEKGKRITPIELYDDLQAIINDHGK